MVADINWRSSSALVTSLNIKTDSESKILYPMSLLVTNEISISLMDRPRSILKWLIMYMRPIPFISILKFDAFIHWFWKRYPLVRRKIWRSHISKIKLFRTHFNPYIPTVPIWGRQNHVVLQTFYLKNGRKLYIKV